MRPITKIEIITRPEKLEELKEAMNEIAVAGMTVTQVYGCGLQRGHKEIYRGKEISINLVPKVKVEIVVCEVPVEKVLETAKRVCRTGQVGDGKIFVYSLDNAVRIRTGEEGDIAIIDTKN
jgi:nitrogen regulatory protein P-II 1